MLADPLALRSVARPQQLLQEVLNLAEPLRLAVSVLQQAHHHLQQAGRVFRRVAAINLHGGVSPAPARPAPAPLPGPPTR